MSPDEAASFHPAGLAAGLAAARASGKPVPADGLPVPPDLELAYRVQAARHEGAPVAGWKAAVTADGSVVSAPLDPVWRGDDITCPAWVPGLAIEIEVAYVLGADLPPRPGRPYSRAEVEAAVAAIHLGIEFVASRIAGPNQPPFPLFLADALGNAGYWLGPRLVEAWRPGLALRLVGSETVLYDAPARHAQDDPIAPLIAFANHPRMDGRGLGAGQVVTTGSLCGAPVLGKAGTVTATLGSTAMSAEVRARV